MTLYTEGYSVEGYLLQVIHSTMFATHWAEISAMYHHSQDARTSFEIAFQAIELANDVRARGTRCFIDAYFTP